MARDRPLVVLVAAGGTVLSLVMSAGKGSGWVLIGMLLVFVFAAFLWRTTYRWAQQDRERWRWRFGGKRR